MPKTAVMIDAIRAFLMCFAAHSAYAREPPATATTTTNAPSKAKNKMSAPFEAICSAIMAGIMVNAVISCSTPTPSRVNSYTIKPEKTPANKDEYTSLVMSARPSAKSGGTIDHTPVEINSKPSMGYYSPFPPVSTQNTGINYRRL